jgi:heterodisulfide reductase subunit C
MKAKLSRAKIKSELVRRVEEISGQKLYACYQCGKCTAGCPMTDDMDILPNQVIRYLQLGMEDVLDSKTIWICASCFTCGVRCPHGIDISKVMEALRQITLRKNIDNIDVSKIDPELLSKGPQQLVVCSMRKFTG